MIKTMSHVTLFVNNQEDARAFYVDKLGFKVHTDATMDNGFRWLTVTAPVLPSIEMVKASVPAALPAWPSYWVSEILTRMISVAAPD